MKTTEELLIPDGLPVVVSYSGGGSSEWMVEALIRGAVPRPRRLMVVMANTGSEKSATYWRALSVAIRCRRAGIYMRYVSVMDRDFAPRAGWRQRSADCLARYHEPVSDDVTRHADIEPLSRGGWWSAARVATGGVAYARARRQDHRQRVADSFAAAGSVGLPTLPPDDMVVDPERSALHRVLLGVPRMQGHSRINQPPLRIERPGGTAGRNAARCTRHYKLEPMWRAVRAWCVGNGWPVRVVRWIGFGRDEAARCLTVTKHLRRGELARYPAIVVGRSRAEQHQDLRSWVGSSPIWSACWLCQHNNDDRWRRTPKREQLLAVRVDRVIRDASAIGLTDGPAYLSSHGIPLDEAIERGGRQLLLPGIDCTGGVCFT